MAPYTGRYRRTFNWNNYNYQFPKNYGNGNNPYIKPAGSTYTNPYLKPTTSGNYPGTSSAYGHVGYYYCMNGVLRSPALSCSNVPGVCTVPLVVFRGAFVRVAVAGVSMCAML